MKKAVLAMFVAVFAVAMVSTNVMAKGGAKAAAGDKAAKNEMSHVTGTLALVKNAEGKATSATITTKSGTAYTLACLTGGEAELDGKEVTAKGEVKDEAGKMTLTVKGKITVAKEKKEKKEKKDAVNK